MKKHAILFLLLLCAVFLPLQHAWCQLVSDADNILPSQKYSTLYSLLFYPWHAADAEVKKNSLAEGSHLQLNVSQLIAALNSVFLPFLGPASTEPETQPADGPIVAVVKDSVVNDQVVVSAIVPVNTDMPAAEYTSLTKSLQPILNKYADMTDQDPDDLRNQQLYKFIDDWYGTRYKWGGNDLKGIDCSAFSQKLYGNVYSTNIMRTSRQQRRHSQRIATDDIEEGDLVFFRMHYIRISHVGVYLANGYFVHASRSHGVVISNLNDHYWQRRFAGCGRIERHAKNISETLSYTQEMY